MPTIIYGIKNCDTMKNALRWLAEKNIDVSFHDYKKQGVDRDVLQKAIDQKGWEQVINRKGTTWRQLPQETKDTMNAQRAMRIASENPSIIKRPLLLRGDTVHLGFTKESYAAIWQ